MSIGSQCPGRVWKDKSVIHHSLVPLRLFLELFHIVLKGRMQSFKESLSDYLISHFQEPLLKYNLAKYTLQTEDESQCTWMTIQPVLITSEIMQDTGFQEQQAGIFFCPLLNGQQNIKLSAVSS